MHFASLAAALTFAVATGATAQQYVYPAKGQTAEQQKSDESACQSWAQQQQQAALQQQQVAFAKASAACLEGRGYTVK